MVNGFSVIRRVSLEPDRSSFIVLSGMLKPVNMLSCLDDQNNAQQEVNVASNVIINIDSRSGICQDCD